MAIAGYLCAVPFAGSGWAQISGVPAQTTWQRGASTVEAPRPRLEDDVRQVSFGVAPLSTASRSTVNGSQPVLTLPAPASGTRQSPGNQLPASWPLAAAGQTGTNSSKGVPEFLPPPPTNAGSVVTVPAMPVPAPPVPTNPLPAPPSSPLVVPSVPSEMAGVESSFDNDPLLFWWENDLTGPILRSRRPYTLTLEQALGLALVEAPELQILHSDWYIRQTEAERQNAAFDWTTYVNSIWNRDSMPVSSTLDGATRRLRSRSLSVAAGLRRLGPDGTTIDISQQMGLRNSNSQFIRPNNQGTTRLSLDIEKPLLRGAGETYNTSPYRLSVIDKDIAYDRFRAGVQDHLMRVATAYWSLVLRRGVFLQSIESWSRAKEIADEMATRTEIDVTPVMLDRARSAVATRLSSAIEDEHDIVRAQDGLLRLIYGARFTDFTNGEVLPMSLPMKQTEAVDPEHHIEVALRNRSEVHESIRQIKAASVRYEVAANELLPQLNLVLSSYVAGLRGDNDVGAAFVAQFSEGEPGVGVGLDFEIPYRNRAAKAAAEQTHVGIMRMKAEMQLTLSEVTEDVRGQVIQRNKYGAVLRQRWEALARARRILDYARTRRAVLADGTRVAYLYLENLLSQQSRLKAAETAYLDAQVRYTLADNGLLRSTSILDSLAEKVVTDARESCKPAAECDSNAACDVSPDSPSASSVTIDQSTVAPEYSQAPSSQGHSSGEPREFQPPATENTIVVPPADNGFGHSGL